MRQILAGRGKRTRRTPSKREATRTPFLKKPQFTPTPSIDGLLRYQSISEFRRDRAKRFREIVEICPHRRDELDPCKGWQDWIVEEETHKPSAKPRKRRAKRLQPADPYHHAKDDTDAPQANVVSIMGNTNHDQLNGQTFAGNNDFGND